MSEVKDWVNERLVTKYLGQDHSKKIPRDHYLELQRMESDFLEMRQRIAEVAKSGESASETLDRLIRLSKSNYYSRGI